MTWSYTYSPTIWPSVVGAIFVGILGLYGWRRRAAPGVKPFAAISLFAALWLLGIAVEAAAATPATKIAWYKFQSVLQLPTVTASTCFALEYAYPGRWLTRRNLFLLSLAPLLFLFMVVINNGQLIWQRLEAIGGSVVLTYTTPGAIMVAYGWCLVLVNTAAFLWLFIRSPQHRWPAALMLFGQLAGRAAYLLAASRLAPVTPLDPMMMAILSPATFYAVALFGFRIFDPLPAAQVTAMAQMPEGMVVFDTLWHVASINPAAARMLSTSDQRARGKTLAELLPAFPDLSARLAAAAASPAEISLESGPEARCYALDVSLLKDFRGPVIGYLLLLRDVTEQKQAQAQISEQQRALATLQERERLARELHDSLGQTLAATHLRAGAARVLLAQGETTQTDQCLQNIADMAIAAEVDVREYLLGAKTAFSADRPFFPALREYAHLFSQQYGLPVELNIPAQLEAQGLGPAREVQVLRIIQEGLSNVRKHARAKSAQVVFTTTDRLLQIAVIDDGQGFDPALVLSGQAESFGLRAMRERAEALGGRLAVNSQRGRGTQVVAQMPLQDVRTRGQADVLTESAADTTTRG